MDDDAAGAGKRSLGAGDFPYRSELLANLSALILLWDSPAFQGEVLAKSGESIDQQSHSTLRHLLAWGPMRPTALSDALGTGASHISKIVRRLENDGWVQRTTDPSDGRATLINLTEAGEAAYLHTRPVYEGAVRDMVLSNLDEVSVGQLAAISFSVLSALDPERRLAVTEDGDQATCAADPQLQR